MAEFEFRQQLIAKAKSWLGYSEKNGRFKTIIDLYNTQKPLPRGYRVKYTDEWCATYVTAVGIKAGLHRIILPECSCSKMIELYKTKGLCVENDAYVPSIGDIVMYDWQDGTNYGTTDNRGAPDHVGFVMSINGNSMTIIEGNKGGMVATRSLKVNGRYIRGYCLPDYASLSKNSPPLTPALTPTPMNRVKAKGLAKSLDTKLAGSYRVTAKAGLRVRDSGSSSSTILGILPYGTKVKGYGYYTPDNFGTKWLYVQATHMGVRYTGFVSSKYLKRE